MANREYSSEQRAAVMAALLAGQSVSSVAKQYEIPKGTVSRWNKLAQQKRQEAAGGPPERTQKSLDELLYGYVEENLVTLRTQARVFRDEQWLKKQNASEVAVLHGVIADKTVRLLEAFGGGA